VEEDGPITVGSDCAGYGSDFIALTMLKVPVRLVFVSESATGKRELMKAAHHDVDFSKVTVYHDITKRDNTRAPYVDAFFTGAPCQAYSAAGLQRGLEDLQHRGVVVFHSLDYVRCQRPKLVVIENVKGLSTGANKQILETIVSVLQDLGYTVEWKILNTKDNGIPHSRPRLYLVAVRTRFLAKPIEFPARAKCADLAQFIDMDDKRPISDAQGGVCFTTAMKKALEKFGEKTLGGPVLVVVDTSASAQFSMAMLGCVPCITKSRGRSLSQL
jgi:DNA-cytosine methyltransferase